MTLQGPGSRLNKAHGASFCASLRKRKGFRFPTGSGAYRVGVALPHWGALTEWGSISPERVARAAKQALCGVNPFRFEKKRLRGPYSNEVAFESGMKRSPEPPFALALPHSLAVHGVNISQAESIPLPHWEWRLPSGEAESFPLQEKTAPWTIFKRSCV